MDSQIRWTRVSLDNAFTKAQSDPSAVLLDSFGRRAFRHEGKVIKYGQRVSIQEARAMSFVKESGLDVPVPSVYSSGICGDVGFIEMQTIEGDTLDSVWRGLFKDEKHSYAQQLRKIVDRLRSLEGTYIGSVEQGPAIDPRRGRNQGGSFLHRGGIQ